MRRFSRRWTEMSYWYSMQAQKKYNLFEGVKENAFYELLHRQAPFQSFFDYDAHMSKHNRPDPVQQQKQDKKLIEKLLAKYPDLRYIPAESVNQNDPYSIQHSPKDYIFKFINKQKHFMASGFDEKTAFEKTEKMFQERITRKIDQNNLMRGLAINNRTRSFLTYYQQQAEYEGRLKVLRLERDLSKYEEAQRQFEEELQQFQDELNQDEEGGVEEKGPIYERVLNRVKSVGEEEEGQEKYQKKGDLIDQFIGKTQNMFSLYYQRAAMYDKLNGLSDETIKEMVVDSPARIKKRSKKLRNQLEKYNIFLNEEGQVDYSRCTAHPNLIGKLQQNPLVQIVLLQQDLDFEFPHKLQQQEQARALKQRLETVQKDKQQLIDENYQEQLRSESEQSGKFMTYDVTHDPRDEVQFDQDFNESLKIEKESLSMQNRVPPEVKNDLFNDEASYKLFETLEERRLRLEQRWIQNKLKDIEQDDQKEDKISQLKSTVEHFRRLKYKLDQQAYLNSKKIFFEEHKVLLEAEEENELLVDKDIQYEGLFRYLKQPNTVKRLTQKDELRDDRIMQMITPKDIKIDIQKPFTQQLKTEKDTVEYQDLLTKQKQLQKWQFQLKKQQEDFDSKINEKEDSTSAELKKQKQLKKNRANLDQKTNQKKLIVDFIKTQSNKKAKRKGSGKPVKKVSQSAQLISESIKNI